MSVCVVDGIRDFVSIYDQHSLSLSGSVLKVPSMPTHDSGCDMSAFRALLKWRERAYRAR